jgi:hypothetical protein
MTENSVTYGTCMTGTILRRYDGRSVYDGTQNSLRRKVGKKKVVHLENGMTVVISSARTNKRK